MKFVFCFFYLLLLPSLSICQDTSTLSADDIIIAIRHNANLSSLPTNIEINQFGELIIIDQRGIQRTIHAVIDREIKDGEYVRVQYQLPISGYGGGTPVPYFGLRNTKGDEKILYLIGSYPNPYEIFELVVYKKDNEYTLYRNGYQKKVVWDLEGAERLFFHMNDSSTVILNSVQFSKDSIFQDEVQQSTVSSKAEKIMLLPQLSKTTDSLQTVPLHNNNDLSKPKTQWTAKTKRNTIDVQVYPNPVTNEVNIKANFHTPTKVRAILYNTHGQMVFEITEELTAKFHTVKDFRSLAAGVYFLNIYAGKERISRRVVKVD